VQREEYKADMLEYNMLEKCKTIMLIEWDADNLTVLLWSDLTDRDQNI
jgi:hypothetical protein